jgi:hypothetical protein
MPDSTIYIAAISSAAVGFGVALAFVLRALNHLRHDREETRQASPHHIPA